MAQPDLLAPTPQSRRIASCCTSARGWVRSVMSRSVVTRLFLVACVSSASASGEGVAQTISSPPMPGLGAAIEGVMGGPVHRSIGAAEKRALLWSGLSSGRHSELHWSSPWLGSLTASADSAVSANRIFGATAATGLLAYGVAASTYGVCVYLAVLDDRPDERAPLCTPKVLWTVAMSVPILGVAGAAHATGASFPRALIGSALGGAAAAGILYLWGGGSFISGVGVLGLVVGVHASLTTLASLIHFRRRPR